MAEAVSVASNLLLIACEMHNRELPGHVRGVTAPGERPRGKASDDF